MTDESQRHAVVDLPGLIPIVQLACTACQWVYEPDRSAFESGTTGCPQCGGWTWIAQLPLRPARVEGVG